MAREKDMKPTYKAPIIVPLGEIVAAAGSACHGGTSAEGGSCMDGYISSTVCKQGMAAGGACGFGDSPDLT